jgi:hypothetical protein
LPDIAGAGHLGINTLLSIAGRRLLEPRMSSSLNLTGLMLVHRPHESLIEHL